MSWFHISNSLTFFADQYEATEESEQEEFFEAEKSSENLFKKENQKKKVSSNLQEQENLLYKTEKNPSISTKNQGLNTFEFYHKPDENLIGINSSIQNSEKSIPSKFSYMGPTKTDGEQFNIRFQLKKSREDYKIVFENSSSDLKIEETTFSNNEFSANKEIVTDKEIPEVV